MVAAATTASTVAAVDAEAGVAEDTRPEDPSQTALAFVEAEPDRPETREVPGRVAQTTTATPAVDTSHGSRRPTAVSAVVGRTAVASGAVGDAATAEAVKADEHGLAVEFVRHQAVRVAGSAGLPRRQA